MKWNEQILLKYCLLGCLLIIGACKHDRGNESRNEGKSYFVLSTGDDAASGDRQHPWRTIGPVNAATLRPGDTVFFESGQTFPGSLLLDSGDQGTITHPIVITSTGAIKPILDGGGASALTIHQSSHVKVFNLALDGDGRKTGNTKDGLIINQSTHIAIDSLDIRGFQKAGLLVYCSSEIDVTRVYAHDNGFAGIHVIGRTDKTNCHDIRIRHCFAQNNPGDPTNLTNHSGNGIVAGYCRKVLIEYSYASSNGWDMPRTGNGPVGIWTYESDSVVIQHCISSGNMTSRGASDGGGYDLDGGVTNSTIQYCLSMGNQGSGFGIFQYSGASPWYNNTVRYNISENDGGVTRGCGGFLVWNSSEDASQFKDCFIYNNTVYNDRVPAIVYSPQSKHGNFQYYNNILVGRDSIMTGPYQASIFKGNEWYSLDREFMIGGHSSLASWANAQNTESSNGQLVGHNLYPAFAKEGPASINDPNQLVGFKFYSLPTSSPLRTGGLNLQQAFGIQTGGVDIHQQAAPANGIGASF